MLDYHLHLWPHSISETTLDLDQIAAYCEHARSLGVVEVALTEHLHRFVQADQLLGKFWRESSESARLQDSMANYWEYHARSDLDAYVDCALEAKRAGLPVVVGLEVDYYRGKMDKVGELLEGYPFDVLLGSVHWIGAWRFDDLGDEASMDEWSVREIDSCWDAYTEAIEELSASGTCDVLAHPDLIKVAGYRPNAPEEWWDRISEAATTSNMAAELSSAGWRKPADEQYPAHPLLERFIKRGVALTTASDAHNLERVADRVDDLRLILESLHVDELVGYRNRLAYRVPVSKAGGSELDRLDGSELDRTQIEF